MLANSLIYVAADHFQHDQRRDLLSRAFRQKIVLGDIDGDVGAQLSQSATFLFAAGGGHDFRAEMFGDLDRRVADAATASLHQQPVAGLEVAVRQQAEPRGEKDGSCRRLVEVTPSGTGRTSEVLATAYSA